MAMESQSTAQIAEYLTLVTTESMGLSEARGHDTAIAKLIMGVKESLGL
ncbi:hypothetical protein [Halomonas sp. KRD171]|nr:hypothetical protein [Halomonas sp. KRD171]